MKQETMRLIALMLMVVLIIFIFFVHKDLKEYNQFLKETGKNPCAFCQKINPDVVCQKIDPNQKELHPCQQCKERGFGVLEYVE